MWFWIGCYILYFCCGIITVGYAKLQCKEGQILIGDLPIITGLALSIWPVIFPIWAAEWIEKHRDKVLLKK